MSSLSSLVIVLETPQVGARTLAVGKEHTGEGARLCVATTTMLLALARFDGRLLLPRNSFVCPYESRLSLSLSLSLEVLGSGRNFFLFEDSKQQEEQRQRGRKF